MNASLAGRLIDASTSLVNGSAPKLATESYREQRVVVRRSQADIEREIVAKERMKLIRRVATL